jgi:hypothetical protein
MTDKRLFGVLHQFKNLIVFANDNGSGKNGAFIDADFKEMRNCVTKVLKDNPELSKFMTECLVDANATKSGIVPATGVDMSRLKLH